MMSDCETHLPPEGLLRFRCPGCDYGLEAPLAFAGVEAPCPVCGSAVQAPMRPETAVVTLPHGFWDESPVVRAVGVAEPATGESAGLPPIERGVTELEMNWGVPAPSMEETPSLTERKQMPGPTREEEEATAELGHRRRQHRLRFFDAALITLFLGTLIMGGAAVAFTQAKPESVPSGSPELSGPVVERMQQLDRQRDQAVQSARQTLQGLLAAVDASLPVIWKAAEFPGPSLLIVHHGLFWKGAQMITGAAFEKLRIALDADLALYSAHLPLDVHPVLGNNACLAAALGFRKTTAFFDWKGMPLGLRATVNLTRDALTARLAKAVGGPVHVCPGGPERIRQVGLITGGAGSEVSAIAATGVDTFITGEGPHWSYPAAEEAGINVLYGGHYATETFGVKALAAHLAAAFKLPWEFIDHPTGL
jgi:dinuclear metal center YbgI/SA1388 family protein